MSKDDFYEDDEPLADIEARFEAGEKDVTAAPSRGKTMHLDFSDLLGGTWTPTLTSATNHTSGELAHL